MSQTYRAKSKLLCGFLVCGGLKESHANSKYFKILACHLCNKLQRALPNSVEAPNRAVAQTLDVSVNIRLDNCALNAAMFTPVEIPMLQRRVSILRKSGHSPKKSNQIRVP